MVVTDVVKNDDDVQRGNYNIIPDTSFPLAHINSLFISQV